MPNTLLGRRLAALGAIAFAGTAAGACAPRGAAGAAPALQQSSPQRLQDVSPRSPQGPTAPARSSHAVIGADILRRDPERSILDVVARTWPQVLRAEPLTLFGARDPRGDVIGVYSGGTFVGGQEYLRTMRAGDVLAVYRLSPGQEFARYGHAHDGGALELVWHPNGR